MNSSGTEQQTVDQERWSAVADRFWASLENGDVAAAAECCTPATTTWHSFDRKLMTQEEAENANRQFVEQWCERRFSQRERDFMADGLVQRHLLVVRAKSNTPRMALSVCVLMRFKGDRIASLTEYLDLAAAFDPDAPPRSETALLT